MTQAQREAAAERAAIRRAVGKDGRGSSEIKPQVTAPGSTSLAPPTLFGDVPNWAYTPALRKFVDSLPGLGSSNANNLGQFIPIAVPDTLTYPGSDYYTLSLDQYAQKLHSDLPLTALRGYRDMNPAADGGNTNHYFGPVIVAQTNRPVRILMRNNLPTLGNARGTVGPGSNGDLFLPVDTTIMGAGTGPLGGSELYTQNRSTVHLHGSDAPWISDGTPHQWITPAGEITNYRKGASFANVPDMIGPGKSIPVDQVPADGLATYYYPNQQSGRLMFYHDHAYGITRLNIYAGIAAGYLLHDSVEDALINSGVLPNQGGGVNKWGIPLIIQDRTFVPQTAALMAQDPTWDTTRYGGFGALWFPHVYMPNQNPEDLEGANAMGRWDYGPWFWPPQTVATMTHGPIPVINPLPGQPKEVPAIPNPSLVPEAFLDTPLVNGTAYPYLNVGRQAYRFRILNAANDRYFNFQLYYASDPNGNICKGTPSKTNCTEVSMVPAFPRWDPPPITIPAMLPNCLVNTDVQPGGLATGNLALSASGLPPNCWPSTWPTDARAGGVPDPSVAGPAMIQIGTEAGLLPAPAVIPPTPVGYNYNRRDIVVLNVDKHALFLGPAERADVIVDFSSVPSGSTLILYNDAPAPVPGFDPRNDYYTNDPDFRSTGGTGKTAAGFGPNIRTMMQFRVTGNTAVPFNYNALAAAMPAAFAQSQKQMVVGEPAFNLAYGKSYTDAHARISDSTMTFTPTTPAGQPMAAPVTVSMQPKAIQELFDPDYGRMNSTLGVEIPNTNFLNQTTIPYYYIDPPTEVIHDGERQLWKITHNGVDTHAVHFHLFNVQLINRVGWDGAVRAPDANEIGWKETVRMNPLEDVIVALQPKVPSFLPFAVGNSIRSLDVTKPDGVPSGFTNVSPNGNPIVPPLLNQKYNFGWEYVWHCHLLGHEENDMMRPIVINVTAGPPAPTNLTAQPNGTLVTLTWTDNAANETGFYVQRATDAGFNKNFMQYTVAANVNAVPSQVVSLDPNPIPSPLTESYYYRVWAFNADGTSLPSNVVNFGPPAAPTGLTGVIGGNAAAPQVTLQWTDNSLNETGFVLQRATDPGFTSPTEFLLAANPGTSANWVDVPVPVGGTYYYRVMSYNLAGRSLPSNVVGPLSFLPAAPSNLVISATGRGYTTLQFTDNATTETGFVIQRAVLTGGIPGTWQTLATLSARAGVGTRVSYSDTELNSRSTYTYRVQAINGFGGSAWCLLQ